jgi:hypothetical protein
MDAAVEHFRNFLILALAGHGLALAICNLTTTPKDDEYVAKVYKLIEVLAGIITPRAKR